VRLVLSLFAVLDRSWLGFVNGGERGLI